MKTVRLLLATASGAVAVALVAAVAFAAPGAVGLTASPSAAAGQAAYCPKGERARRVRAYNRLLRRQAAERKAYFRRHRSAAARRAFLKKQAGQRRAALRAIKRCG